MSRDHDDTAIEVPFEEQRARALEHYERISTVAGEWSSFVRDAILLADTPSVEPLVGRKPTARRRHAQRLFDAARSSVEPAGLPEHVEIEGGYCTGCGGGHIEPQVAPRDDPASPFYVHRDCYDDTGQPMRANTVSDGSLAVERLAIDAAARLEGEVSRLRTELTACNEAFAAGLDVERLRRACDAVGGIDPEHPDGWEDFAVEVAAEYLSALPTQASDSPEPKETTDDEDFPPGFFLRPETLNKLRESIPADWLRRSVEPAGLDAAWKAVEAVLPPGTRLYLSQNSKGKWGAQIRGAQRTGRGGDTPAEALRNLARALLPTQASDSPEKPR